MRENMGSEGKISAASELVRHEWSRRIEAEYASSALTSQMVLWLIQMGAPRELVQDALRIVADELEHAELSAAVCRAAGHREPPRIDRQKLGIARDPLRSLELDVLAACLRFFCLGETVAVPLFKELRAECSVPTAREALDRILKDEVRHRQFGWDLLAYLVDVLPDAVGSSNELLGPFFDVLRRSYGFLAISELAVGPDERAWGLMPVALYRSILEQTLEKEFIPRFAELNIDAEAAWRQGTSTM